MAHQRHDGSGGVVSGDETAAKATGAALPRRFRAGEPPPDPTQAARVALIVAVLVVLASWATLRNVRLALAALESGGALADAILVLLALVALFPIVPAWRGRRAAGATRQALAASEFIAARVAAA